MQICQECWSLIICPEILYGSSFKALQGKALGLVCMPQDMPIKLFKLDKLCIYSHPIITVGLCCSQKNFLKSPVHWHLFQMETIHQILFAFMKTILKIQNNKTNNVLCLDEK